MIQVTPQTRVLVAVEPPGFRCGIDGLAKVCRERLRADPYKGAVFVFRNRRSTSVKLLAYDGQGFWLAQKAVIVGEVSLLANVVGSGRVNDDAAGERSARAALRRRPSGTRAAPAWRPLNA